MDELIKLKILTKQIFLPRWKFWRFAWTFWLDAAIAYEEEAFTWIRLWKGLYLRYRCRKSKLKTYQPKPQLKIFDDSE